jgi:hypothetical protein
MPRSPPSGAFRWGWLIANQFVAVDIAVGARDYDCGEATICRALNPFRPAGQAAAQIAHVIGA